MAPLIALGVGLMPALVRLLAGDRAGDVTQTVASAVQVVTGTDDPVQAAAMLESNPDARVALTQRLAEIALEHERIAAADRADARQMASSGGPLMFGALATSVVVLALFAFAVIGSAFGLAVNDTLAKLLEYALIAVLSFWVGSSAGSAAKSGLLGGSFPFRYGRE